VQDELLNEYFGNHLTTAECDEIQLRHIQPQLGRKEAQLCASKWFDYYDLHPTKATYLFGAHYRQATRYINTQILDHRIATFTRGFKGDDLFRGKAAEVTGFWKGRMMADRKGIPYDVYCVSALRWAVERLWKRLPRPTQLYSELAVEYVEQAWVKSQQDSLRLAQHHDYDPDCYRAEAHQVRYFERMKVFILTRAHPHFALAQYLYEDRRMPKAIARTFDIQLLRQAYSFSQ
jgi:hypothetical protein